MANYPLNQTRPQTYEYKGERPPMVRKVTDRILDREKYQTPSAYAVGKVFTGATYPTGQAIDFDYLLEPGIRRFTINNKLNSNEESTATNTIRSETSELPFVNTPYGGYIEVISPNHFEDSTDVQNVERYRQNIYLDGYDDAKVWTRAGIKLAQKEFVFPPQDNRHYNPTGDFSLGSGLYVVPVTENGYGDILTDIRLTNEPTIVSVTPNSIDFGWEGGDRELTIDALTGVSVSIQDDDVDPSHNVDLSATSFISCPSKLLFSPNRGSKKFNVVAKKDFYIYSINGITIEKPEIPETDPEDEDWYSLRSLLEYLNKVSFGDASTIVVYFNGDNTIISKIYNKLKKEIDDAANGIWPDGFSRNLLDILEGKSLLLIKSTSLTSTDSFVSISTKIANVAPFVASAMLLNKTAYAISESEFHQSSHDLALSGANGYVSYTRTSFALFPSPKTVTDNYTYVVDTPSIWWTPWEEVTNIDLTNKFNELKSYLESLNNLSSNTATSKVGSFTFKRLDGDIVSRDMSVYTGNNLMYLGTAKRQTIYYSFGNYYLELPDPNKVPIGTQIGLLQLAGKGHVFSTSLNQYSGVTKRLGVFHLINRTVAEENVIGIYVINNDAPDEQIDLTADNNYTCILDIDKSYKVVIDYKLAAPRIGYSSIRFNINDLKENYKTIYTIDFSTGYDTPIVTYEYCDNVVDYPLERTEETTPIYQKSEFGQPMKDDYDEPVIYSGKLYLYTALRQSEYTNNVTWIREKEEPTAYDLFASFKSAISNSRLALRQKKTKIIEGEASKFEDMIRLRDEIGQYDMTYIVKEKNSGNVIDETFDPTGMDTNEIASDCQIILYIPKNDFDVNTNTYYWGLQYGTNPNVSFEYRKLSSSNIVRTEQRPNIDNVDRDVYVFCLNADAEAAEAKEYQASFRLKVETSTTITELYTEDSIDIESAFNYDDDVESKVRIYVAENAYDSLIVAPHTVDESLSVTETSIDSMKRSIIRLPNGYDLKETVDNFNPSDDLVLFCTCLVMDYDNDGLVTLNDIDTATKKFNELKSHSYGDGFCEYSEPAESSRETQILRIAYGLNLIGCIQQIYQLIRLVKLWIYKTQIHPAYENNLVSPIFILSKRKNVKIPISRFTFRGGYSLNEKIDQNSFRLIVDRDEEYSDCDECDIVVPFTGDYKLPNNDESVKECFWHYIAEL